MVLFLGAALGLSAFAQDAGKVSGRVVDKATGEGMISANVIIKGTRLGAATDLDGYYFILNVAPGEYEVSASMLGYQTMTQQQVIVNINRTTTLDFTLQETTVDIGEEITVVAERPDVQPEKTSTSEIVRAIEVYDLPGISDLSSVLNLSADVVDGHFRGGREGEELYNLGGMGIVNPLNAAAAFVPNLSAVEEVEVITSGFSAQYGNAQSGVVNISMKEGGAKWRARAELRARVPGYKFFGTNPFSEKGNPYLQIFNSPEKWAGVDTATGSWYLDVISYGFTTRYGKDTIQASQIAYELWRQARRNLNREFDNTWDHTVDVTIGGPVSDDVRMFMSARMEKEWPIVPTLEPDENRQLMGNVAVDVAHGMNLRFSSAWSTRRDNLFAGLGGTSYSSFTRWLWDPGQGISRSLQDNLQLGVRFVHTLSDRTFYEVKVNRLATSYRDGAPVVSPDRYVSDDQNIAIWRYFNTPDNFRVAQTDNDFRNETTRTLSIDAALTSQVTQSHLLLAGLQMNQYTIDVLNRLSMSTAATEQYEAYAAKPFEWGVFVQDKMEFEGMIANIGLRFDYYNQNVDYYSDPFFPYRSFDSLGIPVYDPDLAPRMRTPAVTRLQPRIGISFPVSENTVFHLNYGSFLQRPSFERTVYSRISRSNLTQVRLGNPTLKPQDTKSYDVGITQGLGEGFTLDVSGYYKDVSNLLQLAFFFDSQNFAYQTFVNRDYADIRGFSLSLRKRKGDIRGSIKYRYEVATGKSATPFNATPTFYEPRGTNTPQDVLPSPKDIILDFDRTHNVIVNVIYSTDREFGPVLFDYPVLGDVTVSANARFRSGRPYTYNTQGLNLINNKRSPFEQSTDFKISKRVRDFFGADATFQIEIFNVFNDRMYDYSSVFQSITSTSAGSSSNNRNIEKYESNEYINVADEFSPSGFTRAPSLHYYDEFYPFLVNQEWLLYENQPRSIWFGIVFNL